MKEIDKSKPVLVTGGTGYIASWVVKYLLEDGLNVRTTVRDKSNKDKYQHLLDIADSGKGNLEVFEADLLNENDFKAPVEGCELVIHMASPFKIAGIKDAEKDLVEPAKKGTQHVLNAANSSETIKRVVLTSSVVAVFGDAIDIYNAEAKMFTENNWNSTSNAHHQPYPYSKTVAEREAWKMQQEQDHWDLVVINPGFVLGPSLTKRTDSTSIDFMKNLGNGTFKSGLPKGYNGIVDVRDIAQAHIKAGFTPSANGRHICVAETKKFIDIANILKKDYPDYPFPKREVPTWLFKMVGTRFGFTREYISKNIGIPIAFDNSYSKKDLGLEYRPVDQTVKEHFQQLVDDGLVK
ncbi:MAG: aldehyde reductase [Bacteroidales bacterium]|nr:aldehyde reductase [Bacteroidales bacterium]